MRLLILAVFGLCVGLARANEFVEIGFDCLQDYEQALEPSKVLCVQRLECDFAEGSFARVINFQEDVQTMQTPGDQILYSTGTSMVGCIDCVAQVCKSINGTLPIITSAKDNECVLGGGRQGEKVRIPIGLNNNKGGGWAWPNAMNEAQPRINYTNWADGQEQYGTYATEMCTTMLKNGEWSATPCDMSLYHTQRDFIVCSVQPPQQEESEESKQTDESGATNSDANESMYFIVPIVVVVLIVVIVLWRRSLDNGDGGNDTNRGVVISHQFETSPGVEVEYSNSLGSLDSAGYLKPEGNVEDHFYYDAAHHGEEQVADGPVYDVATEYPQPQTAVYDVVENGSEDDDSSDEAEDHAYSQVHKEQPEAEAEEFPV